MDINLIISFLIASILLTVMPGPDNIFVLTESITKGKRNGIALSIGLSLGILIHTVIAATGLSIVIQNSVIAFQVIKYLGAAYLFYLAFVALKKRNIEATISGDTEKINIWKLVKQGFFMNVLNPKVSLFFIAFLPQFIDESKFNITIQMIVLGILFMFQAFLIFVLIAKLSGNLSTYLSNKKFWSRTAYAKAIVLGFLGIALLLAEK